MIVRSGGGGRRAIDPGRATRIRSAAVPLGLGSWVLALVLAASAGNIAVTWVPQAPLLGMTIGTHGALAIVTVLFGVNVIALRSRVSPGWLDIGVATRIRRNLLVLGNFGLLLACLGWLTLGVAAGETAISTPVLVVEFLLPAVLVAYTGLVAVLVSRWTRI
ncbi:hypothetical protein FPZ12_008110 [Amycolatopsis acidicola]|uniref:Uncharacterized protein n=1 Tax=Amycolatopsis acidicola TaxID=2596893 RepID=A0A5N0VCG9_9PSEU|nr:hypothetical protein FPZ12_008110 [Amycolatopsis acidicola]